MIFARACSIPPAEAGAIEADAMIADDVRNAVRADMAAITVRKRAGRN